MCTQTLDGTPLFYSGPTSWSWVTNFKIHIDVVLNIFMAVYWKRDHGSHKEIKEHSKKGATIRKQNRKYYMEN